MAVTLPLLLTLAAGTAVYVQAAGGGASALLACVCAAGAGSAGYDLTWNTVDNSGTTFSSGGGYSLGGTIGQPDAATWSGGGYTLSGGFWHAGVGGGAPPGGAEKVYLPVILNNR